MNRARRVVAIDTSTPWGSVALVERNTPGDSPRLVAEIGVGGTRSHAGALIQRIDALLRLTGWDRTELDLFVACRGPGSFTGLRIGLGTIRGLAVAVGRPAVGVPTLDAMAEAFGPAETHRLPLLDAGRGEVYGAVFDPGGSPPVEVRPAFVTPPEKLGECAAGTPRDIARRVVAFGPGVSRVTAADAWPAGFRVAIARPGAAAAAARLALIDPPHDPESTLAPIYVRPPDASIGGRPCTT